MSAKQRREAITRFSVPVNESNETSSSSKPVRITRIRGKGKAKKVDNDFDYNDDMEDSNLAEEVNPRVMLISLKAVSWRLFVDDLQLIIFRAPSVLILLVSNDIFKLKRRLLK
jgi:hypothetical protein